MAAKDAEGTRSQWILTLRPMKILAGTHGLAFQAVRLNTWWFLCDGTVDDSFPSLWNTVTGNNLPLIRPVRFIMEFDLEICNPYMAMSLLSLVLTLWQAIVLLVSNTFESNKGFIFLCKIESHPLMSHLLFPARQFFQDRDELQNLHSTLFCILNDRLLPPAMEGGSSNKKNDE